MGKVLIVDDNHDQNRLCEMMLRSEGYEVVTARNGRSALMDVTTCMPDVVVMDLVIPDMDGIELLGKLVTSNRNMPIIIHTATDAFMDNFMTWCADAYVIKSSDFVELKDKIRELLDKSKNFCA